MALTSDLRAVWEFVHDRTGVALASDMKALGLVRGAHVVAGVLYENWNDVNVYLHIAIDPGVIVSPRWARYVFAYPFDEAGRQRLTAEVDSGNRQCRALLDRIGWKQEAVLWGAGRHGSNRIIYRLRREDCRLLAPSMAASIEMEGSGHG